MKNIQNLQGAAWARPRIVLALALLAASAPAFANDNDQYGEVNIRRLHHDDAFVTVSGKVTIKDRGQASKVPWVGSWWAYSRNGISARFYSSSELSPAEKMDKAKGRDASIETTKLDQYISKVTANNSKATERQDKIKEINAWLATHPNGNWRNETFGKRYIELDNQITAVKNELKSLLTVDTATEFERIKHGQGEFGVQGWWGHCNAWSGSSIMDPEPRRTATVNGINWRVGDMKALLTESWMEHRSSFFGTRCEAPDAWDTVACKDVTPAAFHIYFVDQLSNKDKAFVIDRFSGDEVWNQPIRGYMTRCTALPKETAKVVKQTTYGSGDGEEENLPAKDLWPLSCTTTFHWVTDGVPHEALLVDNATRIDTETEYANASLISSRYDDQFEVRTITYKLYLTAPIDSTSAEIWGDGEWTSLARDDHGKPDFMWQPLSQTAGSRDYENKFVDYDWLKANVLAKVSGPEAPSGGGGTTTTGAKTYASTKVETNATTPAALAYAAAIPDNNTSGIRGVIVVTDDFKIKKATVIPDISHSYRGDLKLSIKHTPSKISVTLSDKAGGSADDIKEPFDIGAKFLGKTSKGTWTLYVSDREAQDTGKLNGWKLVLEP